MTRWDALGGSIFSKDWGYVPIAGFIRRNLSSLYFAGDENDPRYGLPVRLGGSEMSYIMHVMAYQYDKPKRGKKTSALNNSNKTKYADVEVSTIAKDMGLVIRSVQGITASLKEKGLLNVIYRPNPNHNGRSLNNLYDFTPLLKQCIVIDLAKRIAVEIDKKSRLLNRLNKKNSVDKQGFFLPIQGEENCTQIQYSNYCIRVKTLIAMHRIGASQSKLLKQILKNCLIDKLGTEMAAFLVDGAITPPVALHPPAAMPVFQSGVDTQSLVVHNATQQEKSDLESFDMSDFGLPKIGDGNRVVDEIVVKPRKRTARKSNPAVGEDGLTPKQDRLREWINVLRLALSNNLPEFRGKASDWTDPAFGALIRAAKHMQSLDKHYLTPVDIVEHVPFLGNDAATIFKHINLWFASKKWNVANLSPMGLIKHMSEYVSFRIAAIEYNTKSVRNKLALQNSVAPQPVVQLPVVKPVTVAIGDKYVCPPELVGGAVVETRLPLPDGRVKVTEQRWNESRLEIVRVVRYELSEDKNGGDYVGM